MTVHAGERKVLRNSVASVASVAASRHWPRLPDLALYGLAGDIVRAIAPYSEADDAALLLQFLSAAGNMIGPGPHCKVEQTKHPLILYPVLAGQTSKGRKGTSWGHIKNLLLKVDPDWAENRITTGLSSAEGLISEVRDEADMSSDRRLLVVQGEFASVLKVMARDGNTLSPTLRDAWDGANLRTLVKNNPLKATGAHISLVGHVTSEELIRYLSSTEAHNGFANRFLWVCVKRSKYLPEGGTLPREELEALEQRLLGVRNWASEKGMFEIVRDNSARTLWAEEYPHLSEGLPGLLGAATGRAEAQVLRLAAIYAVLDQTTTVNVDHLKTALAVWQYCLQSAQYIFGNATGNPTAERIRQALFESPGGMTRTEIRDLFQRHKSFEEIETALRTLSMANLASCNHIGTGGRDIEIWFATEAM